MDNDSHITDQQVVEAVKHFTNHPLRRIPTIGAYDVRRYLGIPNMRLYPRLHSLALRGLLVEHNNGSPTFSVPEEDSGRDQ